MYNRRTVPKFLERRRAMVWFMREYRLLKIKNYYTLQERRRIFGVWTVWQSMGDSHPDGGFFRWTYSSIDEVKKRCNFLNGLTIPVTEGVDI